MHTVVLEPLLQIYFGFSCLCVQVSFIETYSAHDNSDTCASSGTEEGAGNTAPFDPAFQRNSSTTAWGDIRSPPFATDCLTLDRNTSTKEHGKSFYPGFKPDRRDTSDSWKFDSAWLQKMLNLHKRTIRYRTIRCVCCPICSVHLTGNQ